MKLTSIHTAVQSAIQMASQASRQSEKEVVAPTLGQLEDAARARVLLASGRPGSASASASASATASSSTSSSLWRSGAQNRMRVPVETRELSRGNARTSLALAVLTGTFAGLVALLLLRQGFEWLPMVVFLAGVGLVSFYILYLSRISGRIHSLEAKMEELETAPRRAGRAGVRRRPVPSSQYSRSEAEASRLENPRSALTQCRMSRSITS